MKAPTGSPEPPSKVVDGEAELQALTDARLRYPSALVEVAQLCATWRPPFASSSQPCIEKPFDREELRRAVAAMTALPPMPA